jgi:twitching motility protein PilT
MFGRKTTDDQNNYTSTPPTANNQRDTSNLSIGGYVSPYMTEPQEATMAPQEKPQVAMEGTGQVMNASGQAAAIITTQQTGMNSDNLLDDPLQVDSILNGDGSNRYMVNTVVNASSTGGNLGGSPLNTVQPSTATVLDSLTTAPDIQAELQAPQPLVANAVPSLPVLTQQAPVQMNAVPVEITSIEQLLEPSPVISANGAPMSSEQLQGPEMASQLTEQTEQLQDAPAVPSVSETAAKNLNPEVDLANVITSGDEIVVKQSGPMHIKDYLDIVIEKNASDLHLTVGYPASLRIDGKLQRIGSELDYEQVKTLIYETLGNNQKELLEVNKEVDMSYQHENKARFRVNAYNERGNLAAAYRLIPTKIRTIDELNIPPVLYDFTRLPQGLFLVTGPTGHGKSTTLAAMLQEINQNYLKHIVTIEDPIEYIYPKGKALVDQRELGQDTHDWGIALRSILRQDPDVVLIGEMRDFETIQAAITIAETGHLVFATLHTNSAAQSIDRIIDVFPPHQQEQVRTQLAGSLKGILSQRLIPTIGGGRKAAVELMIVNPAIQNLIREGKTYQIDNIISTSFDIGMLSLERSLVKMVREGKITVETAQEFAIRPEEVLKLMKSGI